MYHSLFKYWQGADYSIGPPNLNSTKTQLIQRNLTKPGRTNTVQNITVEQAFVENQYCNLHLHVCSKINKHKTLLILPVTVVTELRIYNIFHINKFLLYLSSWETIHTETVSMGCHSITKNGIHCFEMMPVRVSN